MCTLKKNFFINFTKYWTKIPVNFVFSLKKIVEIITNIVMERGHLAVSSQAHPSPTLHATYNCIHRVW